MTNIPTGLPTLSHGSHSPNDGRACVMEMVALLAGEKWTDSPSCTHPVLAAMARNVNDRLPDSERHRLVPLIGRLFGTAPTGTGHEQKVLSVRLAVWSAREVLPLVRESDREVCRKAIEAAEAWADGTGTAYAAKAAAYAAYAAARSAYAAYAAVESAANAANAAYAAAYAAYAAEKSAANAAANAAESDALVPVLTGLIDEYDRLTGRTDTREVTDAELADLACRVAG